MILTLQPVGAVDPDLLGQLRSGLSRFGEVRIAEPRPVPKRAYRRLRKRYRASGFDQVCRNIEGDRVVAITDVELCDPELGLSLVYGHADIPGQWAVVSLSRFHGDGDEKLAERAVKTAVHEIGHTLGLGHHDSNPECVMYFSENLEDTDRKGRDYCAECAKSATLTLSQLER